MIDKICLQKTVKMIFSSDILLFIMGKIEWLAFLSVPVGLIICPCPDNKVSYLNIVQNLRILKIILIVPLFLDVSKYQI